MRRIICIILTVNLLLVFLGGVAFAEEASIQVSWKSGSRSELIVVGPSANDEMTACLNGGLTLVYNIAAERCAHRSWWSDRCHKALEQEGRITFDRIQERFVFSVDVLGDGRPAKTSEDESVEVALKAIQLAVIRLTRGTKPGDYLNVKTEVECRGQGSSTLQGLVSILTLGLVSPQIVETGWIRFGLE